MLCQEMNDFHFLSQESCMTGAFACFQSGLRTCFAITYSLVLQIEWQLFSQTKTPGEPGCFCQHDVFYEGSIQFFVLIYGRITGSPCGIHTECAGPPPYFLVIYRNGSRASPFGYRRFSAKRSLYFIFYVFIIST